MDCEGKTLSLPRIVLWRRIWGIEVKIHAKTNLEIVLRASNCFLLKCLCYHKTFFLWWKCFGDERANWRTRLFICVVKVLPTILLYGCLVKLYNKLSCKFYLLSFVSKLFAHSILWKNVTWILSALLNYFPQNPMSQIGVPFSKTGHSRFGTLWHINTELNVVLDTP
jgi:hypothetical protein